MADVHEKKQGSTLNAGDVAYRNAEGLITSDPTDAVRVGVVAGHGAAAEDASVMVEADAPVGFRSGTLRSGEI